MVCQKQRSGKCNAYLHSGTVRYVLLRYDTVYSPCIVHEVTNLAVYWSFFITSSTGIWQGILNSHA